MEQKENKYITVAYELYTDNEGVEELTEKAPEEHPFQFISGLGVTLDAFEKQIVDLEKGKEFDFTLTVEEAYGEYMEDYVIELPKKTFEINGRFDAEHIREGAVVPLMNSEGQRMNSTVVKVEKDSVTVDLNHPLAGKELHFKGSVVESRLATNEELQGMLNMLSGEGCGCCGGGCGDDCCGDCGDDHHHHDGGCGCGHCH